MSSGQLTIPFKLIESINDTLTNQSPKAALNMCEKYIKKKPDSLHLQAVRAYLLAQTGKEMEAEKLAKTLINRKLDGLMMSTLSKTFDLVGDFPTSASLLGDLFKAQPTLESGFDLFEVLLKSADLKKAFPVALKLSSVSNEPSFLSWALTLLYADHCHSVSQDPSWANESILERVAEKVHQSTIERHSRIHKTDDSKLKGELEVRQIEDLRLLVSVFLVLKDLEMGQETLSKLIAVVEEKNASPGDRAIVYKYLIEMNQKNDAHKRARQLLSEYGLHDWTIWRLYTDSMEHDDGYCESTELLNMIESKSDKRSIILARIFLAERAVLIEDIKSGIERYIDEYPTGSFHAFDIKLICKTLSDELKHQLSEFCRTKALEAASNRVIWLLCADSFFRDDSANVPSSDALYDIIKIASSGDRVSLKRAQEMLNKESGLPSDVTPYSFVIVQLILCLLLGTIFVISSNIYIGNFSEALGLFRLLEIKMIQLDTLVYLVSDHVFSFGLFDVAEVVFDENYQMYGLAQKEMSEGLFKAFKKGQYTLAIDYLQFMKRIDCSIQTLSCVSGSIWSKVMKNSPSEIMGSLEPLVSDNIVLNENEINKCQDNRDRSILADIDITGRLSQLYSDNLPTFTIPHYYYRINICFVLHFLMATEICPANIERHIELMRTKEMSPIESCLINFASVSHNPYTENSMDAFSNAASDVIHGVEHFMKHPMANDLPYSIIEKCSKLYEVVRVFCLLIVAPFNGLSKSRRSELKDAMNGSITHIGELVRKIKSLVATWIESDKEEKHVQYLKSISPLFDSHCLQLLQVFN